MKKKEKNNDNNKVLSLIITFIISLCLSYLAIMKMGYVGLVFNHILAFFLGDLFWIILIALNIFILLTIFAKKFAFFRFRIIFGFILLIIALILLSALLSDNTLSNYNDLFIYIKDGIFNIFSNDDFVFGGGIIGNALLIFSLLAFARNGSYVVCFLMLVIAFILIIPFNTYKKTIDKYNQLKDDHSKTKAEKELQKQLKRDIKKEYEHPNKKNGYFIDIDKVEESKDEIKSLNDKKINDNKTIIKTDIDNSTYKLPPLNLLDSKINSKSSNINQSSANVKGAKIIEILKKFQIEAELVNMHIGPSVTKFEIKPDSGVKVSKILNIQDNIKMELAAKDIRIEAPIPGRSAVGIEIPNVESVMVKMYELMNNIPHIKKDKPLLFALGKDLLGKGVYCELDKMPHLLIAGATGSGKSVCINTIITSFLMRTYPSDLKLVLIDPKKVEFTPYHDIPHLLWPVITDPVMASNLLKKIVVIMEERYDAFADCGVRNIITFNDFVIQHNNNLKEGDSPLKKMPYIVVIIDELADLMMVAGKEVEASIQRITQLARACGIHLIVATQRPSTDVITGLIKSNIPSRISFAVASGIDSRTILDQVGAERLLGNGDMLYSTPSESSCIRLQGVFVTDDEIRKITTHVKAEKAPVYDDTYFAFLNINNPITTNSNASAEDSLFEEVVEYVKDVQKASTSLLQRRFGIGYNRAARLIDNLEEKGLIGPAQGSKPREVYIKKDEE